MTIIAFINATVFDGNNIELLHGATVIVENQRIRELSTAPPPQSATLIVDCGGKLLCPGFIDAHVHAYAMDVNLVANERRPMTLLAHRAQAMLKRSLQRGFTTVRDCGGADYGLWLALDQGWFEGPRLFYCGRMLSQTGGHGDLRHPHEHAPSDDFCFSCGCGAAGHIAIAVDGEAQVRRAVRETLRTGASFVKFAASGGVTSLSGALNAPQFSDSEILAIVDEVDRAGAYCTAHVHPDAAARRAIELGVRCLEHASMMSDDTARLAARQDVAVVPTLAVVTAIAKHGAALGYSPASLAKLPPVERSMRASLQSLKEAGVRVGFGTDLLGPLEAYQYMEFVERAEVFSAAEIFRQATSINAGILNAEGMLGVIAPGALADMLVFHQNPLADLSVLESTGSAIAVLMKDGRLLKNEL